MRDVYKRQLEGGGSALILHILLEGFPRQIEGEFKPLDHTVADGVGGVGGIFLQGLTQPLDSPEVVIAFRPDHTVQHRPFRYFAGFDPHLLRGR